MIKVNNLLCLAIIFLCIAKEFFYNTIFVELQILCELATLLIFIYLSFYVKFKKYEIYILITLISSLILSFPTLGNKMFLLSTKQILDGFLPLLILPKLKFNNHFARFSLNLFFFINIFLTIFQIKLNFFPENIAKNIPGSGLLQNFHLNGFILGVLAITLLKKIDFKQLILAFSVYSSNGKTYVIAYLISLICFFRKSLFIKIKQINIIFYRVLGTSFLITLIILFFKNIDLIKEFLFLIGINFRDKSASIILDQFTNRELLLNALSFLPGNVEEFQKFEVFNEYFREANSNEIALFFYIKSLGIINFVSFCILIYKNCKKLIVFFLISSLHYSYLLNPLTYLVYFIYSYQEQDYNPEKKIRNY